MAAHTFSLQLTPTDDINGTATPEAAQQSHLLNSSGWLPWKRNSWGQKKSQGDALSQCRNRWLFTPTNGPLKGRWVSEIVKCVSGRILTYTMNEFVPPRIKFLPKAAPVDCALLRFAKTRHFLSLSSGGHQHGKRKRWATWTRTLHADNRVKGNAYIFTRVPN